jgi:hypothetical protein
MKPKLLLLILGCLLCAGSAFAISINDCAGGPVVINGSSIVTADLNTTGSCLWLNASNMVLNCQGHLINSSGAFGIYAQDVANITLNNCVDNNLVSLENASNFAMNSCTINASYISLANTTNFSFSNGVIDAPSSNYGIWMQDFVNGMFFDNSYLHVSMYPTWQNIKNNVNPTPGTILFNNLRFENNTIWANHGIDLVRSANYVNIKNNNFTSATYGIFTVYEINNTNITNNIFSLSSCGCTPRIMWFATPSWVDNLNVSYNNGAINGCGCTPAGFYMEASPVNEFWGHNNITLNQTGPGFCLWGNFSNVVDMNILATDCYFSEVKGNFDGLTITNATSTHTPLFDPSCPTLTNFTWSNSFGKIKYDSMASCPNVATFNISSNYASSSVDYGSARITLFGLSFIKPAIRYSATGSLSSNSSCYPTCLFESYDGTGNLTFSVSHWSTYFAQETTGTITATMSAISPTTFYTTSGTASVQATVSGDSLPLNTTFRWVWNSSGVLTNYTYSYLLADNASITSNISQSWVVGDVIGVFANVTDFYNVSIKSITENRTVQTQQGGGGGGPPIQPPEQPCTGPNCPCTGPSCPDICAVNGYHPVCGIDGITYQNPCYAALIGMPVNYTGACIQQNGTCANPPCPPPTCLGSTCPPPDIPCVGEDCNEENETVGGAGEKIVEKIVKQIIYIFVNNTKGPSLNLSVKPVKIETTCWTWETPTSCYKESEANQPLLSCRASDQANGEITCRVSGTKVQYTVIGGKPDEFGTVVTGVIHVSAPGADVKTPQMVDVSMTMTIFNLGWYLGPIRGVYIIGAIAIFIGYVFYANRRKLRFGAANRGW